MKNTRLKFYSDDFSRLQKSSWLNGTVIDALILTFVNKDICYIPVSLSDLFLSCTTKTRTKFDWAEYSVLFVSVNPNENHWTLFILDLILGCVFYLDPMCFESSEMYISQLKTLLFSMYDNVKANEIS